MFLSLAEYVTALRREPGKALADPPVVYVQYDRTSSECWNGFGIMFAALLVELGLAKGECMILS
jgi:hypothetical protein